jgi:hypothetical protein
MDKDRHSGSTTVRYNGGNRPSLHRPQASHRLTPAEVGLPADGRRRVPGLRRTEVAALAGVNLEYYSRLERGALAGVSANVLDAIAKALHLDSAEHAHLFHLAQAADGTTALMRAAEQVRYTV